MLDRVVARNIRVENMLRVLSTFSYFDYIDITVIVGENNGSDRIQISPSVFHEKEEYPRFTLTRINDYI